MGSGTGRSRGCSLFGVRSLKRIQVVSHSFLANDPRVRRAVDAFVDAGWVVEGLFLDQPVTDERLRTWRVPIQRKQSGMLRYTFEYGVFFLWMFSWVLLRSIRHRPDVVYVNSPPDVFALAALPARLFGARVVLDIHDPMPELFDAKGRSSGVTRKALVVQERLGAVAANTLITVHEPLADLIKERIPDAEFSIVMNVPDPSGWPRLEPTPGSRLLVYAGTVANRYGIDDVIGAVALAQHDIPTLSLRIIGDGEDLGILHELVDELDVAERVEFVGRVPYREIRDHLDGVWMGVNVPKPNDLGELSFSNKVVEWVSIGLPVLSTRTSTMEKYFPDGTLFYTRGGDVNNIAESIRSIDAMGCDEIDRHIEAAKDALASIAWSVQREKLLKVVEDTAR